MKTIDVQELADLQHNHEIELIDVRTPAEYREIHAKGARNVPLDSLDATMIASQRNGGGEGSENHPLYVICKSGSRGAMAVQRLHEAGVIDAINVEGGTQAWENAGLPVQRGKKAISLERQVRIAAGSLVFAGTIAGVFWPPMLVVPGFVGAGLIFAGITDTCGMGMALAKMPWNR